MIRKCTHYVHKRKCEYKSKSSSLTIWNLTDILQLKALFSGVVHFGYCPGNTTLCYHTVPSSAQQLCSLLLFGGWVAQFAVFVGFVQTGVQSGYSTQLWSLQKKCGVMGVSCLIVDAAALWLLSTALSVYKVDAIAYLKQFNVCLEKIFWNCYWFQQL